MRNSDNETIVALMVTKNVWDLSCRVKKAKPLSHRIPSISFDIVISIASSSIKRGQLWCAALAKMIFGTSFLTA